MGQESLRQHQPQEQHNRLYLLSSLGVGRFCPAFGLNMLSECWRHIAIRREGPCRLYLEPGQSARSTCQGLTPSVEGKKPGEWGEGSLIYRRLPKRLVRRLSLWDGDRLFPPCPLARLQMATSCHVR